MRVRDEGCGGVVVKSNGEWQAQNVVMDRVQSRLGDRLFRDPSKLVQGDFMKDGAGIPRG
nr:hypothetical protein Itr_chr07CG06330 [Ipomoea trifida]